jgi:hypothetical protein
MLQIRTDPQRYRDLGCVYFHDLLFDTLIGIFMAAIGTRYPLMNGMCSQRYGRRRP